MSKSNTSTQKGSVIDLTYNFASNSTEAMVVDFLNQDKTIRKHRILQSWLDYYLIEALFHKGEPLSSDMRKKAFMAINSIEQRCQQLKQLYSTLDISEISLSDGNAEKVVAEMKTAPEMDFGI
ncbi:MAG: hypothetical protein RLZZ381_1210 [Cyanobacteriota bacterium]|jgi:predicted nucleotide-binding protein (sugar kinase/HSP70/actin superfamily)